MTRKLPTPYSLLPTPSFDPGLLVAALLALFAVLPLLAYPGLPNTADGPAHLMRQAELNQAWRDGVLYPRWAPDLAFGYGMPLFHYAPPLLYQVTQLFHLAGFSLDVALKASVILMLFLYSVGMYLFARDLYGPRAGLLAAAVYLYAPYRLREAYIQGNYGQFCGLAFYPLILWSFHGLVTARRRRRYLPLAALSLAGLLLSHNISAMIFAPLFGAYLVFLLVLGRLGDRGLRDSGTQGIRDRGIRGSGNQGSRESGDQEIGESGDRETRLPASPIPASPSPDSPIPRSLAALALGFGLSAFFWLPAFGERDLIRLSGITTGFFDFRHNFISLADLLALPRPLDLSAVNPYFPLSLGLAQIVFAALALLGLALYYALLSIHYAVRSTQYAVRTTLHAMAHTLFFAAALLVSTFLTLPGSAPIWEAVPLLELAEFPWRWLGPAVLCAAILAGGVFYMFEQFAADSRPLRAPRFTLHVSRFTFHVSRFTFHASRWPLLVLGIGLIFTLAVNLVYLFPSQFIPWGTPTPADALAYEVESGAIGTTSAGEFLPRWADRFPSPETLGPDYAAGRLLMVIDPASLPEGATAVTLARTAHETRLAVSSPLPFTATLRALYWPDWRVLVSPGPDGAEYRVAGLQIARPDGLMRAPLPAGDYQVRLRLFPTPIRRVATAITALALVAFVGLIVVGLADWKTGRLAHRSPSGKGRKAGRLEDWKVGRLAHRSPSGNGWDSIHHPTIQFSSLPTLHAILISAALLLALLVTRPMAGWFRVQSPPDAVYGAQYELRADFGDQVRLLAFDLPSSGRMEGRKVGRLLNSQSLPEGLPLRRPRGDLWANLPIIQSRAGDALPVVLYWRALQPLAANYSVFVHLDAPDGATYASADESNPADIPTSRWPPSLYVRNPLALALPTDLPPVRYMLTAGLYASDSGARLPVTGCEGCAPGTDALPLGHVWVIPPVPLEESEVPNRLDLRLGDQITLLGYQLTATDPATLTLYWRADAPPEAAYTVFIHALDENGELLAQFDAPPISDLYPTFAWLPGQIIADVHSLALPGATQALAVGLYDPATILRLPVTDEDGARVADDEVRVQVTGSR